MKRFPEIRPPRAVACALASVVAAATAACSTSIPPGRASVDAVAIRGNHAVEDGEITDRLATSATPKFLGLFRGIVYDYSVYDASVLQRDLARVERYYRGRGFLEAHARASRVFHVAPDHVRVAIVVDEGPPTRNHDVHVVGLDGLPAPVAGAVRLAADTALPRGKRFDEDAYKGAQAAIVRALTDRGYAYASVKAEARADLGAHVIDYDFHVTPGITAVFGPIKFVGLDPETSAKSATAAVPQRADRKPLLRAIDIVPCTPYSTTEVDAATQALLDLGVFSAVRVVPKLEDPTRKIIPLEVQAEPGKLRRLRLGGGFEFDQLKTEVHGLVGWEDHDFLGGLRDFSVSLVPGVVLYPLKLSNVKWPDALLPEGRMRLQLRQPGFIEPRTAGFVRPELNVFPLLVEPGTPLPDAVVTGYVEPKLSVGLERRFGKHFLATLAYNMQIEVPFEYATGSSRSLNGGLDAIFLFFPQLITTFDFRDDPVHPHAGVYLTNDIQVAGLPFACDPSSPTCPTASDLRVSPDLRGYVPLARGVTFAARGGIGLDMLRNYGETLVYDDFAKVRLGRPVINSQSLDRDIQVTFFRGFFGGGTTSNRGFPLRSIGPWGIVPFINPASAASQVQSCLRGGFVNTTSCTVPIGGYTMWQASAEVRIDVSGPLGVTTFCDLGDVAPDDYIHFRLNYLHMSCGAGARYDTPVGPIRLDIGYRVQPLQVLGQPNETAAFLSDPTFGHQDRIFDLPIAVAFGIGEAF